MSERGLLHSAAAVVECFAAEAHRVERIHHRDGVGEFFGGGGLEPGEAIHRDDLHTVTPR